MTGKYKQGDKVIITGSQPGVKEMAQMIGRVCTIDQEYGCVGDNEWHFFKEDDHCFIWPEKWFEPYEEDVFEVDETEILNVLR